MKKLDNVMGYFDLGLEVLERINDCFKEVTDKLEIEVEDRDTFLTDTLTEMYAQETLQEMNITKVGEKYIILDTTLLIQIESVMEEPDEHFFAYVKIPVEFNEAVNLNKDELKEILKKRMQYLIREQRRGRN